MSDLEQSCKGKIQDAYREFKRRIPKTSSYGHGSQRDKREPYNNRKIIEEFELRDFLDFEGPLGKLIRAKTELEIVKEAKCSKCGCYDKNFFEKLETKIKIAEAMYEHGDGRISKLKFKYGWEHRFMKGLLECREKEAEEIEYLKNEKMVQSLDLKTRKKIFDLLASPREIYNAKYCSLFDKKKSLRRGTGFSLKDDEEIKKTKINDSIYLDDACLARILTKV